MVENASQVLAILMLALAQAVDCLAIADRLAPATRKIYDCVRQIVPTFKDDTPKYKEIAALQEMLAQTSVE